MTEPIARSDALDAQLAGGAGDAMVKVIRFARHTRTLVYGLVASVALDVILSVGLGVVAFQARNATSVAHTNAHDLRVTCQAANTARAANVSLWDYVLSFPSPTPRTPEQTKQIADFKAYVATVFAPRKC